MERLKVIVDTLLGFIVAAANLTDTINAYVAMGAGLITIIYLLFQICLIRVKKKIADKELKSYAENKNNKTVL